MLAVGASVSLSAAAATFQIEEATIADIHAAIRSGQTTCKGIVEAYIERAKAYNGVCTALVTRDGANIKPGRGYVRAGKPLIRRFSPIFKPLFRANHNWVMRRGEVALQRWLANPERTMREAVSSGTQL